MAEIYGSHFEYGGVSSRVYGLVFALVNRQAYTSVSGKLSSETFFNRKDQRAYLIGTNYTGSPLNYEVEIVTEDAHQLNVPERREIEKWLFNRSTYRKMYLDIDDDCYGETVEIVRGLQQRLYLNCRFINAQRIDADGNIIGYTATLEADTGFWWQDPVTYEYPIDNPLESSVSVCTVHVDTDIDEYVYPTMVLTLGSAGGDVTLVNTADDTDRETRFTELPPTSVITLKGAINYVSDPYYLKFTSPNFPRLLDGTNNITVQGNVSKLSLTFQNRRML